MPDATAPTHAPAAPRPTTLLIATVSSIAALVALAALGLWTEHLLLIPPMAASMALVAGAPSLPLAHPRNVVGGQVLSAVVGLFVGLVSHSLWAGAVAGGLALGAMLTTRTSHSPAAATAVIGAGTTDGHLSFVLCTGIAAVVLVAFGWARGALGGTAYPGYWW
ncbi:HPP family protein [Kytococcus schroeteri]|uniref:HPP family protein n=1 Tax=Kytococcus schroeteri TaxID=138300 RepID=UPI001142A1CA|nr:HPP family protein [Kytococcus schroeteri]